MTEECNTWLACHHNATYLDNITVMHFIQCYNRCQCHLLLYKHVALKWIDQSLSDTSTRSVIFALPDQKALFVAFGLFLNWLPLCFANTSIPYICTTTNIITLCNNHELSGSPSLRSWTRIYATTTNRTRQTAGSASI